MKPGWNDLLQRVCLLIYLNDSKGAISLKSEIVWVTINE